WQLHQPRIVPNMNDLNDDVSLIHAGTCRESTGSLCENGNRIDTQGQEHMTAIFRYAAIICGAICLLGVSGTAAAQSSSATPGSDDIKVTQHQDWTVRCGESAGTTNCEMTQVVNNPDSDTPVMRVIMGYPPQLDTAAMVFILPLGTQLTPGVRITVDGGQPLRIPFRV